MIGRPSSRHQKGGGGEDEQVEKVLATSPLRIHIHGAPTGQSRSCRRTATLLPLHSRRPMLPWLLRNGTGGSWSRHRQQQGDGITML